MKRLSLLALFTFSLGLSVIAQNTNRTLPSVGGGLLGGGNYSRFKITDRGDMNIESKWKWGYVAGAFLNFPLSRGFSIEPQVLYSSVGSKIDFNGSRVADQQLNYLSVPLFFKFHFGEVMALAVGPQFDFRTGAKEREDEVDNKEEFKSNSISATGGIEFFPRARVTIFGRYSHGLTKILTDEANEDAPFYYNQGFQAGLKFKLFGNNKPKKAPPVVEVVVLPPSDTDADGVVDSIDKCPTVFGYAKYEGCPIPDTDGDGVNDEQDKCPTVAGNAKYNGCPIPDTDGDGINDEQDKCPNEKGVAQYGGCPVPDSDKDGIADPEDKCPNIPGVKENEGCPAIPKFSASNIQFVSGKAALTANSLKELTEIVVYMNQYKEINLEIDGHTDNVGKAEMNQILSEKRAAAVKTALTKRGIAADRLITKGFGMDQPVDDNGTAAGKARNRRVEFHFSTN
ncbi:MAG: OmpA family protein [Chitinophagaceae bacterium]